MKALLNGVATALLVTAAAAGAAKASGRVINLNGYCDVFTMTAQDGGINDWSFVSMNTDCDDGFGFGGVSDVSGARFANMGGVLFAFGDVVVWALQIKIPVKTGEAWVLLKSTDGVHFRKVNSGTYSIVHSETIRPRGKPASNGP